MIFNENKNNNQMSVTNYIHIQCIYYMYEQWLLTKFTNISF